MQSKWMVIFLGWVVIPTLIYAMEKQPNDIEMTTLDTVVDRLSLPISLQLKETFNHHSEVITALACSPDGKQYASGSRDKKIALFSMCTGLVTSWLKEHTEGVVAIAYSPCGHVLASASWDYTVKLWDVTNGKLLKNYPLKSYHDDQEEYYSSYGIKSLTYSPDGNELAIGTWDKKIFIIEPNSGQLLKNLKGFVEYPEIVSAENIPYQVLQISTCPLWQGSQVICSSLLSSDRAIADSHDGYHRAVSKGDNFILIYEKNSGNCKNVLVGHTDAVSALAWHPNNVHLLSGSDDHTVKLWKSEK